MSDTPRYDKLSSDYDAARNLLERAQIGAEALRYLNLAERELAAAKAIVEQVARMREDADNYQWLVDNIGKEMPASFIPPMLYIQGVGQSYDEPIGREKIDAAIKAARAKP